MSAGNENTGSEKIVWEKKGSLDFFKRYDGPYIKETISLGNHALRKILERQFEYMSRNLFYISAWGRILLGDNNPEDVVKAEDIAKRTLLNAMESVRRRCEQAEELLRNNGIVSSTLYGKMQKIELPITTPGARTYGELLVQADRFYSLNSMLWFYELIDNKMRFANESEVRKEVQNVVRGVASQFGFVQKKVRQKDAAEAARAGEHNEEQLAKDAVSAVDQELGTNSMASSVVAPPTETAAAPADAGKTTKRTRKAAAEATA